MILKSDEVEYRRTKKVEGKNGEYFLHSFEDKDNAFTFYSKSDVDCIKGDLVYLLFEVSIFDNKPNYILVGVVNE